MRNPERLTRSSSLIPEEWLWKNIESQAECERPIYDQEKLRKGEDEQKTFHPVKEPSDFWKLLWEEEGSGDPSAPWLGIVREAIKENVSKPREDGFTFEYTSARKVITKKNNWSAPWPEKIANFFTPAPPPKKWSPIPFLTFKSSDTDVLQFVNKYRVTALWVIAHKREFKIKNIHHNKN